MTTKHEHMTPAPLLLRRLVIPLLTLLAIVLAACSENADADTAACDAFVAMDQAFSIDEDPAAGIVALQDFVAAAPDEIASQVEPLVALLQEDPETAPESEELAVGEGAADRWALENCGDTHVDLDAFNYAFPNMPTELPAGRVAFNLVNQTQNDEFHEALLLRADVNGPAHEALASALGDAISVEDTFRALQQFALVGASLVEPDGDTEDTFVLDLEPGDYLLVCLLPVNSADLLEPYFTGERIKGARHFDEGMFAEFTVTAG